MNETIFSKNIGLFPVFKFNIILNTKIFSPCKVKCEHFLMKVC